MTGDETPDPRDITLATIREWADGTIRAVPPDSGNGHARGFLAAARDVLAILGHNGHPAGEPVILPPPDFSGL
jgi:hypothetical protein